MEHVVDRELVLSVLPAQVWAALVDPARLGAWLGADVEIDLRPGGAASFRFDDGEVRRGLVQQVDEGRSLSFTWWTLGGTAVGRPTTVTMTLEGYGEVGTRLRIREQPPTRARAAA